MDQPRKIANPVCGQLNRENEYFPVPVRAGEFDLVRRVLPSRTAPVCSFSTLRLNRVLTRRVPPDCRGSVHLFITPSAIGPVPSLSGHSNAYRWRSLPRVYHHKTSSSQGSSGTGAAFSAFTMDQFMCASFFPRTHYYILLLV